MLRIHGQTQRQYKSQEWVAKRIHGVITAVLLLLLITATGVLGFALIEDWSFTDALYMTIITLSTVGYGEVHPLSDTGRLFASGLIMSGVCIAAYSFSIIGQTALEGELHRFRGIHKMYKRIANLKDHIIICGYGRLAQSVLSDLRELGLDVVVIESCTHAVSELEEDSVLFVEGNAYEDETLKEAGIERASALLAILPNDSDNVFVTLSARNLNKRIRIIARTELSAGESKLRLAGANQVVAPYRVSGSRIVQQLVNPYVNDFLEIATGSGGERLVLEQVVVPPESHITGQTLESSQLRSKTDIIVAACITLDGEMILSPGRETLLSAGCTLIALGTEESFKKLAALLE